MALGESAESNGLAAGRRIATGAAACVELGLNFIDTALAYGDGHSEKLVGQAVKSAPHRMYVATKIPPKNRIWPASPRRRSRRCSLTSTSWIRRTKV